LDSRWMKNKKRRTGEEIKEHKRKAKADKVCLALLPEWYCIGTDE